MCATYVEISYRQCREVHDVEHPQIVSSVPWLGSSVNTGTHIQGRVTQPTGSRTSGRPEKRLLLSTVS